MDFQSISNFLVQRLGRERERRIIRARGVFLRWRDPLALLILYLFLSELLLPSILPSFLLIPDNARARFPLRLAHIKRQQCLNPFIIFPPSSGIINFPVLLQTASSSPLLGWRLVSLECVHSATREYKQFRQTREDGNRGLSRQTR